MEDARQPTDDGVAGCIRKVWFYADTYADTYPNADTSTTRDYNGVYYAATSSQEDILRRNGDYEHHHSFGNWRCSALYISMDVAIVVLSNAADDQRTEQQRNGFQTGSG